MSQVSPRLTVLSAEQIDHIHTASVDILENTGLKVHSSQAIEIFARSDGCKVSDGNVFLSASLIQHCMDSAPDSIQVFDQAGEASFKLSAQGSQDTIFGVGVTNTHYEDPVSGEIQPFQRHHVAQAARLTESLSNFDLLSTPGVLEDPDLQDAEVLTALEMLSNTRKTLIPLITNMRQFEKMLDLFQYLKGDISSRPFLVPYFNPVTPLVLNGETSDKMIRSIDLGLPIIYSCYGMSGATAPITAASTLVLHNAELLAGLVFSQLIKPGTPIILGCLPSVFEMRHMTSAYTPQTMLVNLACAEMMSHYRIPHAGTSGSGAGWGSDLPASGLLWMNHLTSVIGEAGMVPFVGGNFDSLVFSPGNVVYSNEIIRLTRLFEKGFALNDEQISMETIQEIGPGGNFLQSDQTLTLFREIHDQHNQIWPGVSLEAWQKMGEPKASDLLRKQTRETLEEVEVPEDHDDLMARGEAWLRENRK